MATVKTSEFAKGNSLRCLIASAALALAAGVWADPATSYVSVGSGDATIVSMSA